MDISVIICTYNRAQSLQQTLESIQNMTLSTSLAWELLVIDNNSMDNTYEIVDTFMTQANFPVRYIFEPSQGLSFARNTGIREARGKYIAFTDDDVTVDKTWLIHIKNFYENYDCEAMGGRVLPFYVFKAPNWLTKYAYLLAGPLSIYDLEKQIIPLMKGMNGIIGANMTFKRECFEKYGEFNIDLGPKNNIGGGGDDEEFINRLLQQQARIYYNGNVLVWHRIPRERTRYRYLAKWYFMAGRYMVKMYHAVPENSKSFHGLPLFQCMRGLKYLSLCICYSLNKEKSLKYWQKLFLYIGMCYEYKQCSKNALRS